MDPSSAIYVSSCAAEIIQVMSCLPLRAMVKPYMTVRIKCASKPRSGSAYLTFVTRISGRTDRYLSPLLVGACATRERLLLDGDVGIRRVR